MNSAKDHSPCSKLSSDCQTLNPTFATNFLWLHELTTIKRDDSIAEKKSVLGVHGIFILPLTLRLVIPIADGVVVMYTVHMHELLFEWDEAKNRGNIRKHGVSFEEAQTVFLDDHAIRFYDPDHSDDEDRFLMMGISSKSRILIVCHCYMERDRIVRIISARKATRSEARHYER